MSLGSWIYYLSRKLDGNKNKISATVSHDFLSDKDVLSQRTLETAKESVCITTKQPIPMGIIATIEPVTKSPGFLRKQDPSVQEMQTPHLRSREDSLHPWLLSKVRHLLGCTWSLVPLPKWSVLPPVSTPWYEAVQIPVLCYLGGCVAPFSMNPSTLGTQV